MYASLYWYDLLFWYCEATFKGILLEWQKMHALTLYCKWTWHDKRENYIIVEKFLCPRCEWIWQLWWVVGWIVIGTLVGQIGGAYQDH